MDDYSFFNFIFSNFYYNGGAAAAAGIKKGDIITKFDGQTVTDKEMLVSNLEYYKAGEAVEVVIQRASGGVYEEKTVSVTLAKQVISSSGGNDGQNGQAPGQNPDGEEIYGKRGDNFGSGLFDDWLN